MSGKTDLDDLVKEVSKDSIANTLDTTVIRYSKVWEDHEALSEGLNLNKDDVVLCITSAGDNVLNFLIHREPKEIYAVDLSVAQNALLELKIAAIKGLTSHDEYLQLLGEKDSDNRAQLFHKVQGHLPKYANDFWDKNIATIEAGLSWCGRFEKYLLEMGKRICEHCTQDQIDEFFLSQSIDEQRKVFNSWPLEQIATAYSDMTTLASQNKTGRSSAQTKYVEMTSEEVGIESWKRFEKTCVSVPSSDNFLLSWSIRGNRAFDPIRKPDFSPPYLTKNGFETLKTLVGRITVCTGGVDEILVSTKSKNFTKLILSNIFEYLSVDVSNALFQIISDTLQPRAVIAYYELYNSRQPPPTNSKFKYLPISADLSERIKTSWFDTLRLYEIQ